MHTRARTHAHTHTYTHTHTHLPSFFGLVAIYLVGGSAYRYFGKQERGLRILPNYDFWKGFVLAVLVSTLVV